MKKHKLRIKSNANCNIYIDTEYTCNAEANRFARIELDEGEYMVKVENVSDPNDCFFTEIFLDSDQFIKVTLKEQSNTDSKNESAVAISKDKNTRDDARSQKPSTASQISGIVESLANSKVENKSQSHNQTYKDDSKANNESHSKSDGVSKGTLNDGTKGVSAVQNDNSSSQVSWGKIGKYILIIILVIVIMIIADAIGIKLPPWFPMIFKYF